MFILSTWITEHDDMLTPVDRQIVEGKYFSTAKGTKRTVWTWFVDAVQVIVGVPNTRSCNDLVNEWLKKVRIGLHCDLSPSFTSM
jgi:hypothetical protein